MINVTINQHTNLIYSDISDPNMMVLNILVITVTTEQLEDIDYLDI